MRSFATIAIAAAGILAAAGAEAGNYSFTTFDASTQLPAANIGETAGQGINNAGQVVGTFGPSNNTDGFMLSGGTFTQYDVPGALSQSTILQGINDAGHTAGGFLGGSDALTHGFLNAGGSVTQLDAPFANVPFPGGVRVGTTQAFGLNNADQVVGGVRDGDGNSHGFLFKAGAYTQIDVTLPSALSGSTQAQAINNSGKIVGWFQGTDGLFHSFLLVGGTFTQLDAPFADIPFPGGDRPGSTQAFGINDAGDIVGVVTDGDGNTHGFVDIGGIFSPLDFPDPFAFSTEAFGINDSGQIVGQFSDGTGTHGFVASPNAVPEPATAMLLLTGLAGLAGRRWRLATG